MMKTKQKLVKRDTFKNVKISNEVITSDLKFDTSSLKLFFVLAEKLQFKAKEYGIENFDTPVTYTIKELATAIGLEKPSTKAFNKIIKNLSAPITLYKSEEEWIMVHFLRATEYGKGTISILPESLMLPYYINLVSHYTPLELNLITSFKSKFSIRIYAFLKQYKNLKTYRKFKIESLKRMLGIDKKYSRIEDLKVRVLDVAVNEINEKIPGINLDYELLRVGRKIEEINFFFNFEKIKKFYQYTDERLKAIDCMGEKERRCELEDNEKEVCKSCIQHVQSHYR